MDTLAPDIPVPVPLSVTRPLSENIVGVLYRVYLADRVTKGR